MKLFKILSSAAFSLSLISTLYFPEVKAGENVLLELNHNGINWKLKLDTSGSNEGKFFLRKNSSKTLCKMYIYDQRSLAEFNSCAFPKIGLDSLAIVELIGDYPYSGIFYKYF
tara:strand:- start:75 stop:413 length:339 start_codon:yes stop_codon:yes gene_type:complete